MESTTNLLICKLLSKKLLFFEGKDSKISSNYPPFLKLLKSHVKSREIHVFKDIQKFENIVQKRCQLGILLLNFQMLLLKSPESTPMASTPELESITLEANNTGW